MVPTHFYKEREYTSKELEVISGDLLLQLNFCSSSNDHNFHSKKSFQISPTRFGEGIDHISHLLMVADLYKVDRVNRVHLVFATNT